MQHVLHKKLLECKLSGPFQIVLFKAAHNGPWCICTVASPTLIASSSTVGALIVPHGIVLVGKVASVAPVITT